MEQIQKFEELMKDYIGPNKTIVNTKVTNLTAPGENYMSNIVKIHVILKNKDNGANEDLHLVAKLVIDNEIVEGSNTASITKNEVVFYKEVLPAIQTFEERHGLPVSDFFPKFIAGRINLTGSDIADKDGVVILEDLSVKGFKNVGRHTGFDLAGAKLILKDLATFHGVPLAMKLLEPEKYESKIKCNCQGFRPNVPKERVAGKQGPPGPIIFRLMAEILKSNKEYSSILPQFEKFSTKFQDGFEKHPEDFFGKKTIDAFETLTHHDMWANNTMQIYQDGIIIKNIFLDFQMSECNSPICDLIFFLITSVELKYLQYHFDQLIEFYYQNFIEILKKLGCYGPEYTYDNFLQAMDRGSASAVYQSMFMILTVIFAKKGNVVDLTKINEIKLEDVPQIAKEKLNFLLQVAFKRGWLL